MEEVKILKVELKRNKYLVYSSIDEEPIILTEDSIVNNKVLKGKIFTIEEWDMIKNGNEESILFDKVLNYIDYKPRTKKEIKDYLKKKDVSIDSINNIIDRLIKIRFLDDERYAKDFINEAIRNYKGPIIITHQLDELGIEKNIINKYLVEYTKEIEYNNALVVGSKYQKTVKNHPEKKQRELIYSKLLRAGYSYEISNKVINTLEYEDDNLDNLKEQYLTIKKRTDDKNKIITSLMAKGYRYEDIKKIMNQ